jgi:hypothetical protein
MQSDYCGKALPISGRQKAIQTNVFAAALERKLGLSDGIHEEAFSSEHSIERRNV